MTIKKTILSTVTAAALAAMVTGCGSSSSGTTSTDTTTGATSSVTAVDGYIINATATAVYFDDNNATVSEPMTSTLHTTDSVDSTLDTVGAADYTMTDDTNKSRVRYFTLANKVLGTSGTTTAPATFIDDGSVEGAYDTNDTLFATRFPGITLYAPAGSKVLTPTTTAIFQQAGGTAAFTPANMGEDVNTTAIGQAIDVIAAKLGLDAETIRDIDPVDAVSEHPEYAVINTMLAQVIVEGKLSGFVTALASEDNATSTTTFTQTLTKLETAATTAGLATNVFTAVKADIDALGEAAYIADIPSLNLDKTLNNGGAATYASGSSTAVASVTGVTVDNKDAFTLVDAGDKIADNGKVVKINFAALADDANTTGTADLIIQIAGQGTAEENTTANSSEITVKVTDLNLSTIDNGTVVLDQTDNTKFSFGYQENNTTGVHYISAIDKNSTVALAAGDFISTTANVATINVQTLLTAVDTNVTTDWTSAGFDFSKITSLKVALVDGGKLQKVSATDNNQRQAWGSTSITSIADSSNANLSGNGRTILNLSKADSRGSVTNVNLAPQVTGIVLKTMDDDLGNDETAYEHAEGTANVTDADLVQTDYATAVAATEGLMLNIGDDYANEANLTMAITATHQSSGELNSTFAKGTVYDFNGSVVSAWTVDSNVSETNSDSQVANLIVRLDMNSTDNSALDKAIAHVGSHPRQDIGIKVTDEFGESNSTYDVNATVFFNRATTWDSTVYPKAADGLTDLTHYGTLADPFIAEITDDGTDITAIVTEGTGVTGSEIIEDINIADKDSDTGAIALGAVSISTGGQAIPCTATASAANTYTITDDTLVIADSGTPAEKTTMVFGIAADTTNTVIDIDSTVTHATGGAAEATGEGATCPINVIITDAYGMSTTNTMYITFTETD